MRRFWQQVAVVSCGFILEKVPVLSIYGVAVIYSANSAALTDIEDGLLIGNHTQSIE